MAHDSEAPEACELCGDQGPLFLHARCHLTAPLQASIEDGVLTLSCYLPDCRREVARYRVVGGPLIPPSQH